MPKAPQRKSGGASRQRRSKLGAAQLALREKIILVICRVPSGKVVSYGGVARAAGFPGAARQVVGVLRSSVGLPWHRVLGAAGEIKLRGDSAFEQRMRLQAEGVTFRGRKVNMKLHEFEFPGVSKPKKGVAKSQRRVTRR